MNYFLTSSLCHLSPTQFPGCNLVVAIHLPRGLWQAAGWQPTGQVLRKAADTQQQRCFRHHQLLLSPILIPSPASELLVHQLRRFQWELRWVSWASWRTPGGGMQGWRRENNVLLSTTTTTPPPPPGFVFPSSSSHLYKNCRKVGNRRWRRAGGMRPAHTGTPRTREYIQNPTKPTMPQKLKKTHELDIYKMNFSAPSHLAHKEYRKAEQYNSRARQQEA